MYHEVKERKCSIRIEIESPETFIKLFMFLLHYRQKNMQRKLHLGNGYIEKKNQQSIYNGRRENKENESTCPFIYEHK